MYSCPEEENTINFDSDSPNDFSITQNPSTDNTDASDALDGSGLTVANDPTDEIVIEPSGIPEPFRVMELEMNVAQLTEVPVQVVTVVFNIAGGANVTTQVIGI